jgi:plastocyanin
MSMLFQNIDQRLRQRIGRVMFAMFLLVVYGTLPFTNPALGQEADSEVTGSVKGVVKYIADPRHPWRLGRYYIANANSGELAEAVVALSVRGVSVPETDREPETVTIDQKNFQFVPEVAAIRTGDRVRFLNSDDHVHNVKTLHPRFSFNVNMPSGAEHVETFSSASGIRIPYQIDCVFHSSMRAWIFVFDHPWFAITGRDGVFELEHVPAGEYRIEVTHPAGKLRLRKTVVVKAGKTSEVRLELAHDKSK